MLSAYYIKKNIQTNVLNTHEQTNSNLINVTWQKLLLRVAQQAKKMFSS
jgi:hypothetical protein